MDKTILTTTLLLGLVGIVAMNIKQFIGWCWNIISDQFTYSLKVEESSQFFYAIQNYIMVEKNSHVKNFYFRTIYDNWIDGETTRDMSTFYNRGILITDGLLILKINEAITNSQSPYKNDKQSFHIYTLKRKNMLKFIDYVKSKYLNDKIRYYFNSNGDIMVYGNITNKTFDNIFLNNNIKEKIKEDIDKFNTSKELYASLGLKYKRTYLLHGSAGGGKSSIATAIANYCRRDILTINMSKDMTDSTLISLIARRPIRSIILFEDIDCLFDNLNRNDENKDEKSSLTKISLSCILNILDGSYTPNDTIFVITTNFIDKLDPALKRDGRINMMVKIALPNKETKREYVNYIAKCNKNFNPESINLDEDISISTLEKNLF